MDTPVAAAKAGRHFLPRWALWVLGLLLIAVALGLWHSQRGKALPAEQLQRRDFVQTVVASARVEAPHRVDLAAQITGTVSEVPVAQGQAVAQGQLLVALEASELKAAQRQAEAALQQAQLNLRRLGEVQLPVSEQQLRQAQATLDLARAQLQRSEQLHQQGFIGAAALDEARKSLSLAEAQARVSQAQTRSLQPAGSELALARAALSQAEAAADLARARARYTRIQAPVAGTLIARNVEVGDVVQAGRLLMTLSPQGRTELVLSIDEKNLRLLQLGQPALASADAYPEQRFAARVAYINPGINAQTGAVEVRLAVDAPPVYLRQDMTVSADIEVGRRQRALLLGLAQVHEASGQKPWVWRVDAQQGLQRREIELGLRSGGWVEVLGGLAEGDVVLQAAAADAAGLKAGDPVRPVFAKPTAAAPRSLPASR
ncbi:efflux RND transporter periplasmic adaptor subunit [Paucibacter aquatile]|uniref:Efflux RND transporter periplasmic adaptor subunit n=1 Tax=Kinneretia aquatilis TaxID=2070761 RepID=A0A2N8KSZ4_9BURK|nr:efflux RND transporter periplasmic adaptor subunit [Paucibacter aquatile]PND36571.1 efflux RND transporter periplasmic adaptor subunit [Paucibacter aquatile]